MRYAYYPGCSLHSSGREYEISLHAVCERVGIELKEPKNWICCGSTPAHATSHLLSVALPLKNLVEIEKEGFKEVIVPCASCFSRFRTCQFEIENDKEIPKKLGYNYPEVKVTHPLEIFSSENMTEIILHPEDHGCKAVDEWSSGGIPPHGRKTEKKGTTGVNPWGSISKCVNGNSPNLKVVCYYGCLLTRPPKIMKFDECEYPQSMDRALSAAGIKTLDWNYKTDCCGATLTLTETPIVLRLCKEILEGAKEAGADAIAVACPLCHANLDVRQKEVEETYGISYNMPIFYFTQLIGLALGIKPEKLGLNSHFVSTEKAYGNK